LWPQKFGNAHYERLKKKRHVWFPMYQQDPSAASYKRFRIEWLNFYEKKPRPGKFPTYMLTDRGSEKQTSDPTFIGVFCTTPEKRILLVDGCMGRFDPDTNAAHHIRLLKKWHPRKWIYEEIGLQRDTWYLSQLAKKEGLSIRAIPVGQKGPRHMLSKEQRIDELTIDFSMGRIWLPDIYGNKEENVEAVAFPTWNPDGDGEVSIIQYFIEREYSEYAGEGSITNDEILDVLSRLHEPELGVVYPTSALDVTAQFAKRRNRRYSGGSRSWESRM
jgi:hypothetical protein